MIATTIYVRPDGPYIVTGDFSLEARGAPRDDSSVTLCRCGRSANKPYCDGTHTRTGFVDPGFVPATSMATEHARDRLKIIPEPNGPLRCAGPVALSGAGGRICECCDICLCCCGRSATQPFCDCRSR
jgi:CDGSH-type Zn-finger protein